MKKYILGLSMVLLGASVMAQTPEKTAEKKQESKIVKKEAAAKKQDVKVVKAQPVKAEKTQVRAVERKEVKPATTPKKEVK